MLYLRRGGVGRPIGYKGVCAVMLADVTVVASIAVLDDFGFSEKGAYYGATLAASVGDYTFEAVHLPYVP